MATIKSFTDLQQSKKLAEILSLESADMWWNFYSVTTDDTTPQIIHIDTPWVGNFNWDNKPDNVPCWSLAALLGVMPRIEHLKPYIDLSPKLDSEEVAIYYHSEDSPYIVKDNLIDACYEMIINLHKHHLL